MSHPCTQCGRRCHYNPSLLEAARFDEREEALVLRQIADNASKGATAQERIEQLIREKRFLEATITKRDAQIKTLKDALKDSQEETSLNEYKAAMHSAVNDMRKFAALYDRVCRRFNIDADEFARNSRGGY